MAELMADSTTLSHVQRIVTDALTTYEQMAPLTLPEGTALDRASAREFASALIMWGNKLSPIIESTIRDSQETPDPDAVTDAMARTQEYLATLED